MSYLKRIRGSKFGKAVIGAGGVWLLKIAVSFGLSFALGRFLGVDSYGVYAICLSWVMLLSTVSTLGFNVLSTRELSKSRVANDRLRQVELLRLFPQIVFKNSLLVLACFTFIILTVQYFGYSFNYFYPLIIAVCIIPVVSRIQLAQGEFRGMEMPVFGQFILNVLLPGGALLYFVLLLAMNSVAERLWVAILAYCLSASTTLIIIKIYQQGWRKSIEKPTTIQDKKVYLKSSAIIGLSAILVTANEQLTVLLCGALSSAADTGFLDMARKLSVFSGVGLLVLNIPLGPRVAELFTQNNISKIQSVASKSAALGTFGSVLVLVFFALFGRHVLAFINPDFKPAYWALIILCCGQFVNCFMGPVRLILNMTSNEKSVMKGLVTAVTANLSLSLFLIPQYGFIGGAIASSVSLILWNLVLVLAVKKQLGIWVHALAFLSNRKAA